MIIIALLIVLGSKGPIFFWSDRVGKNNIVFKMPKFRTMYVDAPNLATHLLNNPEKYLTSIGSFLRKTSLDEIPQLWSVFVGNMTFVGPRPALFNQYDLIELRNKNGISSLLPGITGWAQINGRDGISIQDKVKLELIYVNNKSILFDFKILVLTLLKVLQKEGINH